MTFSKENLIASSELVDVYKDGDTCIKLFKEGVRKTNCPSWMDVGLSIWILLRARPWQI